MDAWQRSFWVHSLIFSPTLSKMNRMQPLSIDLHEVLSVHDLRQRFPAGVHFDTGMTDADFPRLAVDNVRLPEGLRVQVGFTGESLTLRGATVIELACRRCAEPVQWPLAFFREFRLFDVSADADQAIDVEAETVDTLATQDRASLASLVEDEVLLECLAGPAHQDCSILSMAAAPDAEPGERVRPFAQLADLIHRKSAK